MSTIGETSHSKGITFTEPSAERVRELLLDGEYDAAVTGLRIGVRGGGCSGYDYELALDERRDDDAVFSDRGLALLVRKDYVPYIDGAIIDYVETANGAAFQVTNVDATPGRSTG